MPATITFASLAAVFQKQIKALQPTVTAFAKSFGDLQVKRAELAPKLIGLFNRIKADQSSLTFVAYTQMFDSSIPDHAAELDGVKGYRVHRSYMALDYLRRLTVQVPRGRQGKRDSATDIVARALATALKNVRNVDAVWQQIQGELNLGDREVKTLRGRVENTKPLFELPIKAVTVGNVIHMDRQVKVQAAPEPVAAPARRRRAVGQVEGAQQKIA